MSHVVSEPGRMNTLVLGRELTDRQWELVAAILPVDPARDPTAGADLGATG